MVEWWLAVRKRVTKAQRKAFDSMVLLIAWCVWLQRNTRVHNQAADPAIHVVESIGSVPVV
jgi:hypothetical protein